jgi:hypothetical protein|tara:strand:- start:317 stop:700 length:384 start_codon:yes stop_codon:yes gene_type:complete
MPSFGTLKADTLTHSTAGSLNTEFVVDGSAKSWNTVISMASTNSLNVSSVTDVSAGQSEDNFTNSFSAANYASSASHGGSGNILTFTATNWYDSAKYTTSLSRTGTYRDGNNYLDTDFFVARFGDLA